MAHANQERWSKLVDAKLRNQLVTRDNYIFNNRYEGDPKAGKVKIPVRDTEVSVKDYNKATGIDPEAGTTTYLELNIDQDEAVNELIDGFDAASVPDGIVADRLDSAGYSLGLSIDKKSIERGQVLSKPGSIHPHTKFVGQVYVLTKDEGGRHTPFFNNYRPQFYFRTTDVTGVISLPEGVEMCMPGDNVVMNVELITPIAIEKGLRFAIREGGRTVGSGVVTEIEG